MLGQFESRIKILTGLPSLQQIHLSCYGYGYSASLGKIFETLSLLVSKQTSPDKPHDFTETAQVKGGL